MPIIKKSSFIIGFICLISFVQSSHSQTLAADTLEQFFLRQFNQKHNVSYAAYGLASLYFDRGNYKQALVYAKENLKSANDFDTACTILYARSLEMNGRYSKAERVFRMATQRYAGSSELWLAYGFTLYKLRKYREAEHAFEMSLRLNPFVPPTHYLLGFSMLENKNNPACLQAWMFGLMIDRDTLRSAEMLRLIHEYVHQQYDSIRIPFFDRRLSLKYPDQLFFYNYHPRKLENFYLQFMAAPLAQVLTEKIEQHKFPTPYSRFYKALSDNNLLETFCYFTFRNMNLRELKSWYSIHRDGLEQLAEFLDTQLIRPF